MNGFDCTAQWVWRICRGLDDDIVEDRKLPKSLSCGKTFYSRNNLRSLDEVGTTRIRVSRSDCTVGTHPTF